MALQLADGPIKKGHVPFGHDLARCAIVYDLCYEHWTPEEIERFHRYMNSTVDANVRSEPHVFHNGWYGYKNWGIGLAGYATYHENPRAVGILRSLESEFRTRAAPALELAGDGGGWGEGYYVNYWLYEWLLFCEVARWCEGVDYYAMAPASSDIARWPACLKRIRGSGSTTRGGRSQWETVAAAFLAATATRPSPPGESSSIAFVMIRSIRPSTRSMRRPRGAA